MFFLRWLVGEFFEHLRRVVHHSNHADYLEDVEPERGLMLFLARGEGRVGLPTAVCQIKRDESQEQVDEED